MFEITRYEVERREVGTAALVVGLAVTAALFVAFAPSVVTQANLEMTQVFPETLRKALDITAMSSLAGFLAAELYNFIWVILFGMYVAYSAGALIAADVETDRMETLLARPVSRAKVVREKFLALLVPILAANVVAGGVVYAGATMINIDASLTFADVVAVHALSIPYLLCCAAIGLGCSVLFGRGSTAQRVAMALIFALFLFEAGVGLSDYAWLGAIAPMRYYHPTAIMVHNAYDVVGGVILLGATIVVVGASEWWFRRTDLS